MTADRLYKPGEIIASLYEVRDVFAGGMGEVYLAYHRERRRHYALKTIQEKFFRSKENFLEFRREVEVWIMLFKHPHIVQAITVRDFEGRLFLVLEYVEPDSEGRNTLSDYLSGELLPLKQILVWALQFCDGMIYAKGKGLQCHRDIKPSNIMVTKDTVLKITDFGLAKTFLSPEITHSATERTSMGSLGSYEITADAGHARGTLPYMAPESFSDYKGADEISDIYSFGVVLFAMLTGGDLPFVSGINSFEAYERIHQETPVPQIDSPLFPVVKKCLAKGRSARLQGFAELREELERYFRKLIGPPPQPMKAAINAEDIRHFAQALFELKRYEEALTQCNKALEILGEDYETWDLRGRICHALKKHDEALRSFDEAIKIKEDHYAPWNNKGILFQERGETEKAISCFRRVTSLRPDYREAWNNIGACLQMQGRLEEAVKNYRRAVELDSRYRDALVNMGDCFIQQREYPKALECYEKAEEVDPYEPYILENLGKLYRVLGFSDKECKIMQRHKTVNQRREGK